jgi:hypothetical protein
MSPFPVQDRQGSSFSVYNFSAAQYLGESISIQLNMVTYPKQRELHSSWLLSWLLANNYV